MATHEKLHGFKWTANGREFTGDPPALGPGDDWHVEAVNRAGGHLSGASVDFRGGESLQSGSPVYGPNGITDTTAPDQTTTMGRGFRLNSNVRDGDALVVSVEATDNFGTSLTESKVFALKSTGAPEAGKPETLAARLREIADEVESLGALVN